ncbi:hypothetical protein IQ266_08980 [filamentous cyanobacterium LEGE 11480]|uniref:Uncharacterized protein n=1 Tax=Romeriopsis navalis LEGE 11480 TaxID=2777977 RepID=A0A928VNC0_9CYAN|nr:hypothetical protein [Romeriopsis navalis]MBE9029861.1 hypothetical protein [Romeriopsis navalis LEGE 11480]
MSRNARYWKLTRLDLTGHRRAAELPEAKAFFAQQFATDDDLAPNEIQTQLLALSQTDPIADLCLRCFISNQIEQVCIQLEQQFGLNHGFSRQDLFPLVLDDDGKIQANSQYVSTARHILNTFEPGKGSLATWTIRLVKHNRELNKFLLESGVCLLSDWAILNDTNISKLRRVYGEFHSTSAFETEQAVFLLEAYHAVYRADRLIQRQAGVRGACPPPSEEQLERIRQEIGEGTPRSILAQLQQLATQLRQYRVASRAGRLPTVSMESGESVTIADRIAAPSPEEDESAIQQNAFLQAFRGQFATALEAAFNQVITARTRKYKGDKPKNFIAALKFFHCEGMSMTEIAAQVGLKAQFQVSRLLNLKTFREDVRHQMVQELLAFVKEKVADLMSPDRLKELDATIETALNEQIEGVMQEAAAQAQSPKDYVTGTMFSRTLCGHLDRAYAKTTA